MRKMEIRLDRLPLRERNKQRVTQRIITVAVELFKTRGYHQTTIDEIAEKAEISRGTLFNYFPSKEALLLPWAHEILDGHIYPRVSAFLNTQPTTMAGLRLLFTVITETVTASPDVVQAFMHESLQSHDASQKALVENGIQRIFLHVIRYGQEKGEVRTDIPSDHLAFYLSALLAPLLFSVLELGGPEAASINLDTVLSFIMTGLRSGP